MGERLAENGDIPPTGRFVPHTNFRILRRLRKFGQTCPRAVLDETDRQFPIAGGCPGRQFACHRRPTGCQLTVRDFGDCTGIEPAVGPESEDPATDPHGILLGRSVHHNKGNGQVCFIAVIEHDVQADGADLAGLAWIPGVGPPLHRDFVANLRRGQRTEHKGTQQRTSSIIGFCESYGSPFEMDKEK